MASIVKEGKYYKIYFIYGGKRIKRSLKTGSKKIALQIQRKIEDDLALGLFNIRNYSPHLQKSLSEFIEEVVQYAKINKSSSTVMREERILKNFFKFVGDVPIQTIKSKIIEAYKKYLLQEKDFSKNGVNIELRHLSAAFSIAVKYDYIPSNPFKKIQKVQTPKKKPIYLTKNQAQQLLDFTRDRSIYPYILISLSTGARISEVCKLKFKDIDFENRTLRLHGKGSKERTVPIPKILYNYLTTNLDKSEFVVKGSRNPVEITHQFRKYADKIQLSNFTFHNLRDTYASWLVQSGQSLKIIQELLGHESIQTTLIYAHLAPDNKFEVIHVMDSFLK